MTIASQHASQEITKLYQQEPPAPSLQQASAPSMESNNNPLHKLELQLADGEVSALRNISALCKEGTERTGHGVVLTLNGDGIQPSLFDRRLRLSVDLHGSQVFTALPSGLGFLAPSLLPQEVTATSGQGLDRVSLTMGVGLTQLSRGRVDQVLQTLMDAGDEPFVFEFRDATNNQLVGFLPTKASVLKSSMECGGSDIHFRGDLPSFSPKGKVFLYVKWLKCLIMFALATWLVFLNPSAVLSTVPSVYLPVSDGTLSVVDVLPLHPANMSAAFQMGALHEQLNQEYALAAKHQRPVDAAVLQELLRHAAELGGKADTAKVTEAQLRDSLQEIIRIENQVSVVTKVRGFFSFINCIWFFSILGICMSLGPSLYTVSRPLQELIIRMSTQLFHEVILPIGMRLHSWGIIEVTAYGSCWLGIVEGYRIGEGAGMMVALTGSVLCIPCVFYSSFLWGKRIIRKWKQDELLQLLHVWLITIWVPCAIHFQSTLLGYGVVLAMFFIAGLDARISPLLIQIGFESEEKTLRCTLTSLLLITVQASLRVLQVDSHLLTPFASAVGVLGNNVFFLSLLLLSFMKKEHETLFNLALAVSCVVFNLIGQVLAMTGMANVAITYTILTLTMKYGRFHLQNRYNSWVLILIVSISVWRLSLFLHMHPEYITGMFVL